MENVYTIDFETTGIDAKTCHPVEVAIVGDNIEQSTFIKPPIDIPPETSAVHHITDTDVQLSDSWLTVFNNLSATFTTPPNEHLPIFVAHNAQYEKDIIDNTPEGAKPFPPVIWVCTYKCALRVWPNAPAHKNEVLRYWLRLGDDRGRNADQHPHSALHDAKVTYLLLLELLKHATIAELVEWTEKPAKLPYVPMGKHYKEPWSNVPGPYLVWICKTADMREDIKFCAQEELNRRK